MEFIVGKWYKNPGNFEGADITWAKFEKWENNKFYFFEWITKGNYEDRSSYWCYGKSEKAYNPINIEEIRQYLPFKHPDLFVKNKNMNYLIPILKKHRIK